MVKILSIFVAAFAASHVADAGYCTPGLKYCGKTLAAYGGYGKQALFYTFQESWTSTRNAPSLTRIEIISMHARDA
ncbi:hypothetical protein E4U34_002776 [Claviceps purpurea]|nr:hypothetical protein E4U34_002776 [Claviceps purpurea]